MPLQNYITEKTTQADFSEGTVKTLMVTTKGRNEKVNRR